MIFLEDAYSIRGHASGWPSGQWEDLGCHFQVGTCPENSDSISLPSVQSQQSLLAPLVTSDLSPLTWPTPPCPWWPDSGTEPAVAFRLNMKAHHREELPCFLPGRPILVVSVTASDLWCLALDSHPTNMRDCWWLSRLNDRLWPFLQGPIKCLYKYWK